MPNSNIKLFSHIVFHHFHILYKPLRSSRYYEISFQIICFIKKQWSSISMPIYFSKIESYQSIHVFSFKFVNCAQQKRLKKVISIFFPVFPCILPNWQHIALLMSFMNLYELRFRNMLCFISHHFKCNANTATHE